MGEEEEEEEKKVDKNIAQCFLQLEVLPLTLAQILIGRYLSHRAVELLGRGQWLSHYHFASPAPSQAWTGL